MYLKDVVEIKKHLPDMEIEIFVHGSMCFAYSGRCLISAVQMGRVPNRGSCANDCRFEYTDRKSTRLNSSHQIISYAVFCLKKKKHNEKNKPRKEKDKKKHKLQLKQKTK